jgi:peptidoglycan/LPS O-acetylase OafA/YrhL
MIQRIQSVWLLLASILTAGLFVFDMYHANTVVNNLPTQIKINVGNDYLQLLLALIMTLLPFSAIFLYKNRGRQRNLIMLSAVLTVGFVAYMIILVTQLKNRVPQPTDGTYWIGAVLPVLSLVCLFMANKGIKKDEKLLKSLDRLR